MKCGRRQSAAWPGWAGAVAVGLVLVACGATIQPPKRTRMTTREIVDHSKPAIVRVEARYGGGRVGIGTGFVVASDGRVATNLHVVRGSRRIDVTLLDGTKHPIDSIVGVDAGRDLVLLQFASERKLPVLRLGDSDRVSAGDPVIAIGNPLGVLDYTVSDGLISSIREFTHDLKILQISAPISEGSSGGPLFNPYGEVIGVATMIFNGGQNLNFGVPSNYLRALLGSRQHWSVLDFSRRFGEAADDPADDPGSTIERQIPVHDLAILDGCPEESLIQTFTAIRGAIAIGAPLYNEDNHEGCYRVYEGTALRLQRDLACEGLRAAISEGLDRAAGLDGFDEKSWALRDAFDGVMEVLVRHAEGR